MNISPIQRRKTIAVALGELTIGGGAPISVQSMTKCDTRDVDTTVRQIEELQEVGCDIVRLAVPDKEAAVTLKAIKARTKVPLVADIHFDYRLAMLALEAGVDGLRLNPGNINVPEKVRTVVRGAKERGVPIRIGVNGGSLPKEDGQFVTVGLLPMEVAAEKMVKAALGHIKLLEELDFNQIVVSLKATDVWTTVYAYRRLAPLVPYAFHLGITEAGTLQVGTVRSSVGLGILLSEGLGDTIRISLTAPAPEEVKVGQELLRCLGLRQSGPVMISCPSCGRIEIDLFDLAAKVEEALKGVKEPIHVAVMGCAVNGPGESRGADVGVAGGANEGLIFRKGKVVRKVPNDQLAQAVIEEIQIVLAERDEERTAAAASA